MASDDQALPRPSRSRPAAVARTASARALVTDLGPVLGALLVLDSVLLVVHVVGLAAHPVTSDLFTDWQFNSPHSLSADRGYAERFGYLKGAGTVGLLALACWSSRRWVYLAWAALYAFALLDDAVFLHEKLGAALVEGVGLPDPPTGLRAQDLAELVVWAGLGAVPVAAVLLTHWRSDGRGRQRSTVVAVLFGALIFCEVVLDQLHSLAAAGVPAAVVGIIEDGGALVVLSVTVTTALGLWRLERRESRGTRR